MMVTDHRAQLKEIRTFRQLVAYLRDALDWPIDSDDFEDLTFDYTPEELGIDVKNAAKIQEIKRLRPLIPNQPWGIFFVKFEPKRLPVVALRRILGRVALKKRASSNSAERQAWAADDLLFVSNYGEGDERRITFAHFSKSRDGNDLPTLKVLGWDNLDTPLHLDDVAEKLTHDLAWPDDDTDVEAWRKRWRAAFTLRHREVITTSKGLSLRLAELARAIRDRIRTALAIEIETGPLTKLMRAFQEALVHDLDTNGFADMYAQTISYGLLSARIADPESKTADDFANHMQTNPFLKELMETFLRVGGRRGKAGGLSIDFDELGVSEVVELLDDAIMEAVVRDFGDRNPQEDPVIHFYEYFLAAYDKKQRVKRGVFYTPRPVVTYIVRSVDKILRTEFSLEDGLADTTTWGEIIKHHKDLKIPDGISPNQAFIQILDPATGTGTFLVEVIDLIQKTLAEKWKRQGHSDQKIESLWNDYVPKHLLPRLHGYELLMAPYAIAHLKIGLKLYESGYHFGSDERVRIYLTNALEPAHDFSGRFEFAIPALAHEAEAVNEIKRRQRFTVVVGNPPYSVKSYNNGRWIRDLLADFKKDLNEIKLNLDDDYIKFLRLLTYLAEACGAGVFSMITNNSFLSGVTHRQIRRHLLSTFSTIKVTDLHGDSRYGEIPPEGLKNKNVFDIQQGVCVSCLEKLPSASAPLIAHADVWGSRDQKYSQLLLDGAIAHKRIYAQPPLCLFQPTQTDESGDYESWPLLTEWMPLSSNGIETHKDKLTLHFTPKELSEVIDTLLSFPVERARAILNVGNDGRDWALNSAIASLRKLVNRQQKATRITYRPFDVRYTMLNAESGGFIAYPRWAVMSHLVQIDGNVGLVSARLMVRGGQWDSCLATRHPTEKKTGDSTRSSTVFPLLIGADDTLRYSGEAKLNLSRRLVEEIRRSCCSGTIDDELGEAHKTFSYLFALLHSPEYRERYKADLRTNFPRLPVPRSCDLFHDLARLGGEIVALHLMESSKIDSFITAYTGPKNPTVEQVGWSDGTVWLDADKTNAWEGHRATKTGTIGFHGVPKEVWNFHIGGYQVCHKWLKDRKGRTLTEDDIAHYQKIVVALNETIRIMAEIDEVIDKHGGWPGAFQAKKVAAPITGYEPGSGKGKMK